MLTEDKIEQFRTDVAGLRLKTGGQRRDTALQIVGLVLMLLGLALSLWLYEVSLGHSDQRAIASDQILAVAMLVVAVIGAALFVFAALARFLRFWMLRQLYEGQAHIDTLVASLRRD